MSGVLITRPAAQAERTSLRLEAAGFKAYAAPLLEIEPASWQMPDIAPQAVLLTSANAVPALAASPVSRQITVLAVGDRTAAEAERAGFTRVESAAGDARALYDLILERCEPGLGALLYLSGETVAGHLAPRLSAAGYWVETRVVYRALATETFPDLVKNAMAAGWIDAVLLYSPRSAAIFSRLMGTSVLRPRLSLYCLSPAVAQAAGSGWHAVSISPRPDEDSLIEALVKPADVI